MLCLSHAVLYHGLEKSLSEWHCRSAAWAWHGMCELTFKISQDFIFMLIHYLMRDKDSSLFFWLPNRWQH
jgi:hypothetical protein